MAVAGLENVLTEPKTELVSAGVGIVVEREYRLGNPDIYEFRDEYAGHPLYYNQTDESGEFNIYKISAYIDTGAEQYFIDYEKWTTGTEVGFNDFLSTTIRVKEKEQ